MGSFQMSVWHTLGKEEARRRLQQKLATVRQSYSHHVSQLNESWEGHVLSFSFRAAGMNVSGTITVEDSQVSLDAVLPLAAMMFRGLIEQRIRQELGDLLA
jgi:hypothetical protein